MICFFVPGSIETRTGGSIYNRRLVETLRRRGHRVDVVELDASFPRPTPAALDRADRALAAVCPGAVAVVDSLILGAIPGAITREASRLRIVALIHLPLFAPGEDRALHAASLVVVTGKAAIPLLARYDLAAERIVIIEPGTDRSGPADRRRQAFGGQEAGHHGGNHVVSGVSRTFELLCVGTLNPIKNHEVLLESLAAVPHRNWHLTCAGSLTRDPETAASVRAAIARLRLEAHVTLVGDLDRDALEACYDRADLFVLATRQETYGMAVAEALAHGLPVVATMTGAIPELVGQEAGLVVPVGDRDALAAAIARVMNDPPRLAHLAEGARRVRGRLPTWDDAADRLLAALASLDAHG